MKQSELISKIAEQTKLDSKQAQLMLDSVVKIVSEHLSEGKTVGIQSFGNFEVRQKNERLSVHPTTKERTLIPPKLVVNFKQSSTLKDKLKSIQNHE